MRKKIIVIVLTVLLFLSGALLGFTTVFRVSDVVVEVSSISAASAVDANEVRDRLKKLYEKENILFVDRKKAEKVVTEYPHFRIAKFKKDYPNRVVLSVTEETEIYAVKKADAEEYYILGADGRILAIRQNPLNRLDENPNVIIEGLNVQGKKGEIISGDDRLATILSFCNQLEERLNGIRDNVVKVQVSPFPPQCWITMREGVKIYVTDPEKFTVEKANKIIDKYLELSDEERLGGCILNVDNGDEIIVAYQKEDIAN